MRSGLVALAIYLSNFIGCPPGRLFRRFGFRARILGGAAGGFRFGARFLCFTTSLLGLAAVVFSGAAAPFGGTPPPFGIFAFVLRALALTLRGLALGFAFLARTLAGVGLRFFRPIGA